MNARLAILAAVSVMALSAPAAYAQKASGGTAVAAADGAILIDQTRVTNGGVTAGDTAGFPLTISQNGRYRLSGDMVVPAGKDGIVVAPGVDAIIEMSGFSITGAANCSRTVNCFSAQGTYGIRAGGGASVQVSDGRVRGFSAVAIGESDGQGALLRLTDVRVQQNGIGVYATRLHALRVLAEDNAGRAIHGLNGSVVDSIASDNGNIGIFVGVGVLRGNVSTKNSYGYMLYSTTVANENVAFTNVGGALYGGGVPGGNNAFVN